MNEWMCLKWRYHICREHWTKVTGHEYQLLVKMRGAASGHQTIPRIVLFWGRPEMEVSRKVEPAAFRLSRSHQGNRRWHAPESFRLLLQICVVPPRAPAIIIFFFWGGGRAPASSVAPAPKGATTKYSGDPQICVIQGYIRIMSIERRDKYKKKYRAA